MALKHQRQMEKQLRYIFRLMLDNKTDEEISTELDITIRTVQRYKKRIDNRYGEMQRQKSNDTLFTECQLFKNRMLTLYKGLENIVTGVAHSGHEKAKCAEVAANIAIDVLKMESEGIKAVKDLGLNYYGQGKRLLRDISSEQQQSERSEEYILSSQPGTLSDFEQSATTTDPNRKF